MFRKLTLNKGKGTCGQCQVEIPRGRTCWAAKKGIGEGRNYFTFWTYRCFKCVDHMANPEDVK